MSEGARRTQGDQQHYNELVRWMRKARGNGEMDRKRAELRLRWQDTRAILTLVHESAGIAQA